jgi:hypothetical protein
MCMACCSTQTHYHHTEPVNILHLLINVAFSTNVIVVCLIQSEIEPTIYHTHGEHANLQSTTLMENTRTYNLPHSWRTREAFHNRCGSFNNEPNHIFTVCKKKLLCSLGTLVIWMLGIQVVIKSIQMIAAT